MDNETIKIERVHDTNLINRLEYINKHNKIVSVVPYATDIAGKYSYYIIYTYIMDDDIPF